MAFTCEISGYSRDEELLIAHIKNQNDVIKIDHEGHKPQWEWFEATHADTQYFYDISPDVKSKKRNWNCNTLGSFSKSVKERMDNVFPGIQR